MERDKDFLNKRKRKRKIGDNILIGDIQALIQYFKKRD